MERNERGFLKVNRAWTMVSMPNCVVIEMPDGAMKFFGVRMTAHPPAPLNSDLRGYKGHHPDQIPDNAVPVSETGLIVWGLCKA